MEQQVRDFIVNDLGWRGQPDRLTADYPLIDNDVLDSMGILQLIGFLEDTFGVVIDDTDLLPDNFATLGAITALVTAKRQQQVQA